MYHNPYRSWRLLSRHLSLIITGVAVVVVPLTLHSTSNSAQSIKESLFKLPLDDQLGSLPLMQHEIYFRCGDAGISAVKQKPQGELFMSIFLKDRDWMRQFLCSGPLAPAPDEALMNLYSIWLADKDCATNHLYKRLATATAIVFSSKFSGDRLKGAAHKALSPLTPVTRYMFFKNSHKQGKLHKMFDSLDAWDMRYVVSSVLDNDSLAWLQKNINIPLQDYVNACWANRYRGASSFGESIQSPYFYEPWDSYMNRAESIFTHGGVCGSLSTFGANAACAHGIPAITMGQPGHCAYGVRIKRGQWEGGFGGPEGSAHQPLLDTPTSYLHLAELIYGDWEKHLKAQQLRWLAHVYSGKAKKITAYEKALVAHPINFEVWKDYIQWRLTQPSLTKANWQAFTVQLTKSLQKYPRPMFDLLDLYQNKKLFKGLDGDARIKHWSDLHTGSNSFWIALWVDLGQSLDEQYATFDATPKLQKRFVKSILKAYSTSDKFFPVIIGWAQKKIGNAPTAEQEFISMIGEILNNETGLGNNSLRAIYAKVIISAEKVKDKDTFTSMSKAVKKIFGKNEKKLATYKRAAYSRYKGMLLSENGMLRLSSTSKWDMPLTHADILTPVGGQFHTDKEVKPWAEVTLAKLGELSGIVILNRLSGSRQERQVPIKVSVSEDGKHWTTVFESKEVKKVWQVDLTDKKPRARYVRVQRSDDRAEYFHLGNILVYGRKLQ